MPFCRKLVIGILLLLLVSSYTAMPAENQTSTNCTGLPFWLQILSNNTSTFITNAVLGAINVPFCVWAFLGNLAVVIAICKTPSLQRPTNRELVMLSAYDPTTVRPYVHSLHVSQMWNVALKMFAIRSFRARIALGTRLTTREGTSDILSVAVL